MVSVLVLLAYIGIGFPGHATQTATLDDGGVVVSTITDPGSLPPSPPGLILPTLAVGSTSHRAEQLWVDRNHQNAIANEACISGAGPGIFAAWYLNNKRVSKYVTVGNGIPQWTYLCSAAAYATIDVAATFNGLLAACNNTMGTFAWLNPGSAPSLSLEPASVQDLSEDATRLVYVDGSNNLVCVDTGTGGVLWDVPLLTVGNGLYGVDISGSGSRVLVSAYEQTSGAQVYSMTDGSLVGSAMGNYGQTKAAISEDGNRVVIGNFNGQIRMFQWSGSAWTLAGSIATGDSWVTAVAISADGHTVAGGTLGFSPYRGKVVAVDWPASSAPASMWDYKNYGDEVSSVAICDDGSVIVAGSWGTYGATSGDVFTALDHTGAVIFNLLDDVDEPGSILSVDVSDDGSFATACGKAVHARAMGSGGEVYGIQIMDAQTHDVGVVAIISPAENQQVGNSVTPQITVGNFGTSTESFGVSATIREAASGIQVWSGSGSVSSLAPGAQANVSFSSWTVPAYGSWILHAQTNLASDTYAANDSLDASIRAYHDAGVSAIVCPYAENTTGMAVTPVIEITNGGTYTDNIQVSLVVNGPAGQAYSQTVTASNVAPGALAAVSMPSWTPGGIGSYTADASAAVTDDYVPGNNDQSLPFDIVYEIIYDDGSWESMYWVGSLQDDMFTTRFTPTVGYPCTITQARIFVNNSDPFSWAAVCPDDGTGRPDTANPLYYVENLTAPGPLSWIVIPMSISISSPGDLWLVAHWPDAKSVAVGTDMEAPIANRSWWHNTQSGWTSFTGGDFLFRMTAMPPTGTPGASDQPSVFALGLPSPNPSAGFLSIPVEVPSADVPFRVAVYDLSGRCLSTLSSGTSPAGMQTLSWDCTTSTGPAPAGIYFVRLEAGSAIESRKVVILR
jgi:WD40 repeat protein